MDWHHIYLGFLSAMFLFWNGVRILTYIPTIRKLMRASASGRDYSLATWGSWVCSNGFFALYLWEHGGRQLDAMVLLNIGNACMCLITCYFIVRLQRRSRRAGQAPSAPAPGGPAHRLTGSRSSLIVNLCFAGPLAVLLFTLAATPAPAMAAPVTVDYGALGSGSSPSPLVVSGLSAQAGAGRALATFRNNGLGVVGNDPFAIVNGSTVEFDESILFLFPTVASDVFFTSTIAFNLTGVVNPQINLEAFGIGGGSLGSVSFDVFRTFPTYEVSGLFGDVDLSGFRLFGNGQNTGMNVATVSFDPSIAPNIVAEPAALALFLIAGAAAAAASHRRRPARNHPNPHIIEGFAVFFAPRRNFSATREVST